MPHALIADTSTLSDQTARHGGAGEGERGTAMPKIAVDPDGKELVDERMVPVLLLAREHGLHPSDPDPGDPEEHSPAQLVFPTPAEALEFLTTTQHYASYELGDHIMLSILPLEEKAEIPKAKVNWLPNLTHYINEAWRASQRHG